ncbi:Rv1733c family protein [Rhodococcoides fascians]|uniref:Rv1733c family protein n=1 Tax=Rhodococcoides fascians TaxID=1828 RepID=UPI00050CC19E|nr:hypothetical protein [Rhodococcus fascians]
MIAELVHRWWRRSPWITSPLMRLSDRIERTAFSVGVAILLLLIPVSATVGSVTYSDLSRRSQQQRAEYLRVDARIIDYPKPIQSDDYVSTNATGTATVRWTAPDGTTRTGSAQVPSPVSIGDTTQLWLDARGNLAHTPATAAGAVVNGTATAVFVWFLGAIVIGGLVHLITAAGDRSRKRQWDEDWQRFVRSRDHPSC